MTNLLAKAENFDWEKVKRSITAYSESIEIGARVIDENGEVIYFTEIENSYDNYCSFISSISSDGKQCKALHLNASHQAEMLGEAAITFCHGGLVFWTVPLIINGQFKGALIGGPVLLEGSDDYNLKEVVRNYRLTVKQKEPLILMRQINV